MKKIKHIIAVIIRSALIMVPGAVSAFLLWNVHGALVAILAALGVEFVTCAMLTFIFTVAAQVKAQNDMAKAKDTTPE